jgi:hypothetical protein
MKLALKILIISTLLIVIIMGTSQLMNDIYAGDRLLCCNENFPNYSQKNKLTSMYCEEQGEEFLDIPAETCARYWSAYGSDPQDMCIFLPEEPPLPSVPVPGNFDASLYTNDDVKLTWNAYHVHWSRIWRKKDTGSWKIPVSQLTPYTTDEYVDYNLQMGSWYYYKMRGSVYDIYSNYTATECVYIPYTKIPPDYREGYDR